MTVKRGISSLFALILGELIKAIQQIDVLACQNIRAGRYAAAHCTIAAASRRRWPLPYSCQTESRTYSLDYATLQCRSCCCFIHKQDFGIIQKTRWTGSGVPST